MRFSFVFAVGLMRIDGQRRTADGSLVSLSLPRGPEVDEELATTVDETPATVPAIDILGVIHGLHEQGGWRASGAAAQLVGGRTDLFDQATHRSLRALLAELLCELEWGTVQIDDLGEEHRPRWRVSTVDRSGKEPLTPKLYVSRQRALAYQEEAERLGRWRVLSARVGWPQKRLTELLDEQQDSRFRLTEVLELAQVLDGSPSELLAEATKAGGPVQSTLPVGGDNYGSAPAT